MLNLFRDNDSLETCLFRRLSRARYFDVYYVDWSINYGLCFVAGGLEYTLPSTLNQGAFSGTDHYEALKSDNCLEQSGYHLQR